MKNRRLKYFSVSAYNLPLMIQGKLRITNVPGDVQYVRSYYDFYSDSLIFIVEHPSFEIVDDCCTPPVILAELEIMDEPRR